ncbi:MAG: prepilin-type N-terminal cleavage/methylation domain-containing protein [Patescibacteria group bacterium]
MIGVKMIIKNKFNYSGKNFYPGFSLMEVMVSVALFSVIILSATSIFKLTIDSQRSAIATQNVQESLKYFLEVTNKEMRMAQKNDGDCPGIPDNEVFAVVATSTGDMLIFKNYYGQCVSYSLVPDGDNQRFHIARNLDADFISPAKIRVDALDFILTQSTSTQAMVTINLRAFAINERQFKSDMTIQTSITSRYYK